MRNRYQQLRVLTLGIALLFAAAPVFAQTADEETVADPNEIMETTALESTSTVTTEMLDVENAQSLRITPIREERVSDDVVLQSEISPNANGEFVLRRQTIVGLQPMTVLGGKVTHDIVAVTGQTEPYAFVTLIMRSGENARTEVTRATKNGRWEIRIAVDFLASGEHTTYLQTELNGVHSNELQIAKFVVVARDSVSNSTWIFIALITLAILLLLVASTLQIRQNRMAMEEQVGEPVIPDGHEKKPVAKK